MPLYRIQTSLQDVSSLPRDQYVTTLHIAYTSVPSDAQFTEVCQKTAAFFQLLAPNLSSAIATPGAHTIKIYHVGAPKDSPPVFQYIFTMPATGFGAPPLPNEVALCVTFHGSPQPGVMRQSWRGRVYLGPWSSVMAGSNLEGGRPKVANIGQVLNAATQWMHDLFDAGGKPVIYSRKLQQVFPIATVGMDDAWDTQRSRGLRPTHMTLITLDDVGAGGPPGPAG